MGKIILTEQQFLMLLNEATTKEIYDKYYNDIDYNQFFKIVVSDPKTKVQNNDIIKIGPYSKVLLNIYRKGNLKNEDLPKATEYLGYVYKYNLSVDIKYINNLSDIYDLVSKYIVKDTFSVENVIKSLPSNEYKILLDSKNWYIISPESQKAACYFGYGTQWCTTWGPMSLDPKLKERTSHYNRYKDDLYIIINKNNENNKYQFHFDSKQFKNPSDGNIDAKKLLNENTDLKYFFFPSLYNKNLSSSIINQQIEKLDILDNNDIEILFNNVYGEIDNPIVKALLENDEDALLETFSNEIKNKIESGLSLDSTKIKIPLLKSINRYLISEVKNLLQSLDQSRHYVDCPETEINEGMTEYFLEKYYEENKNEIDKIFKISSIDECKSIFLDELHKYKSYIEDYTSEDCNKYEQAYESYCSSEADKIKKFIDFSFYDEIEINKFHFISYIIHFDINKIDDVYDIIANYIEHNDISGDLEWDVWEFQEQVSYEDVKLSISEFFETMEETNDYEDEDDEENQNCIEIRKKFIDIRNKIFKNQDEIDNEIVHIKLYPESIDCKNGTIRVELTNKQTNKTEDGMVKIDNLPSHVMNYKLFENIIRFKKLI